MSEKLVYVFGHRNPDTDAVCGAIALSYLKNQLGMNTIPCTLGIINEETEYALNYFKVKKPFHLNDVKLQIKDINYHKNTYVDKNISIKDTFDYMNKYSITGVPLVENKNKYYGFVSLKEIVKALINGSCTKLNTSYGNILKILNGTKILKFDKEICGKVFTKESISNDTMMDSSSIFVTENNADDVNNAISIGVKLIIIVSDGKLDNSVINKAIEKSVNIISTPYSIYDVSSYLSYANYIRTIMIEEEISTFNEIDYLSDFLEESKKIKHTNYPIINNRGECTGLLTANNCNNVEKKKVILVDHNNYSQSVEGLEEAEILEVIDHHNIGDIFTKIPINFRTAIVGSVNTILYDIYNENNIEIPASIAGIMASSIISDTLLLTSPTTTEKDRIALRELSKIAGIDYNEYGVKLLKQGMSITNLTNEQILYKDFKTYKVDSKTLGIGQVLTSDFELIDKDAMVEYLDFVCQKNNYNVVTLFVTDIFNNISYCLYNTGSERIIKNSFDLDKIYEGIELKNILSRKVQIAPYIMESMDGE